MAATIHIKWVNKAECLARLNRIKGQNVKTVAQRTMSDMKSAAPTLVARMTSQKYAMPATKLNPNTKAGSSRGSVSLVGGLAGVALQYRGERLALGGGKDSKGGSFPLSPRVVSYGRRQTFKSKVYRSSGMKKVGHYATPWSEGGAYGAKSPAMPIPSGAHGVTPPVERQGRGGFNHGMRGPSVPQMVQHTGEEGPMAETLEYLLWSKLERHVNRLTE